MNDIGQPLWDLFGVLSVMSEHRQHAEVDENSKFKIIPEISVGNIVSIGIFVATVIGFAVTWGVKVGSMEDKIEALRHSDSDLKEEIASVRRDLADHRASQTQHDAADQAKFLEMGTQIGINTSRLTALERSHK